MRRFLAACLVWVPLLLSSSAPAAPSSTIVISEFRTRGPNGANDEFIELFNKSNAAVNIGGYKVMASDAAGTTTLVQQIAASTTLQPRHFFLLANNGSQGYSGAVTPNATYSQGVSDDGGIALFTSANGMVDQVGMSPGSAYQEGAPLDPLTNNVNQSYERNNGGCAATRDTDDNSLDFRLNGSQSFPQNTGTNCNTCVGVTCVAPPNSQCWISPGVCAAGSCGYTQRAVNFACSDGDACTVADKCDAGGVCVSGSAATCTTPPAPFCSDPQTLVTTTGPGICSSVTGCSYNNTSSQHCTFGCNGTTKACNPDPCTSVSCNTPPTNGCYLPTGVCSNGTCIYTPRPRLTVCSDGDECTVGDACDDSGGCLSGAPKAIDDSNPCTVDACNTGTGAVTHANATEGTDCDDGDQCNGLAVCKAGTCTNGAAVTCNTPPIGGCYAPTGTCNKANGACTYAPLSGGSSCTDTDPCTTGDECDGNGSCGGSALGCPTSDTCVDSTTSRHLFNGSCQAGLGTCAFSQTDKNCPFGCDAGSGLCTQDPCVGVVCNSPPGPCLVGVCSGGNCSYVLTGQGTSCDDGDACTSTDVCSSGGACAGTPLLCTPPAAACLNSTTSRQYPALGTCSAGTCDYGTPQDLPCSSGCDALTGLCDADACASMTCDQPPDQCHVGACSGGVCSYAAVKPDASSCDDANPCTENDVCTAGVCAGEPITCNTPPAPNCVDATTSETYDASTTCNSVLGECGSYAAHDTTCTAGCNTATGVCNGDPCATTVCDTPPGSCYLGTGACQSSGTCLYGFRAAGVSCDDVNPCTDNDACDGTGKCAGTAIPTCGADGGIIGGDASTGGAVGTGGAATADASSTGGAVGTGGSPVGTGGSIASSGGGSSGSTGGTVAVDGGSPDAGAAFKAGDPGGCGCSIPNRTSPAPFTLALAAVGMLALRRRKSRA